MALSVKQRLLLMLSNKCYEESDAAQYYVVELREARDVLEKQGFCRATVAALPVKDQVELALEALRG